MRWAERFRLRSLLTLCYGVLLGVALAALGTLVHFQVRSYLWNAGQRELTLALRGAREVEVKGSPADWSARLERRLHSPGRLVRAGLTTDGGFEVFLWSDERGHAWQVVSLPLVQSGSRVGTLWLGRHWGWNAELLHELTWQLVSGSALVLALVTVLGLGLARGLAGPLERLAGAAARLAGGDWTARTGLPRGRNEVLQVAANFDLMAERVEAAFAAQTRFVADASHELRSPLTAMGGMVDLLRAEAPDRERILDTLERETERMNRLVSDLLLLSRGQTSGVLVPVIVEDVLREEAAAVASVWPDREVTVSGSALALADRDWLGRVLRNLLENALKYAPGQVELSCGSVGGLVQVSVVDHGPGIPAAQQERVFDRFFRADVSRARLTGGAGLGLSIVRTLTESMGGEVRLTETPGGGVTARLQLPLARLESP